MKKFGLAMCKATLLRRVVCLYVSEKKEGDVRRQIGRYLKKSKEIKRVNIEMQILPILSIGSSNIEGEIE